MAKILFGGPQEKERGLGSPEHDDLIKKLQENHEVSYVVRGDEMMGELMNITREDHDLVIYDTQLFYDLVEPVRRAEIFKDKVRHWLLSPGAPVIVLADSGITDQIKDSVDQARFIQINKPYNVEDVVKYVDELISSREK